MKKILYLCLFFALVCCIAACCEKDNNTYESEGLITSHDTRECVACCGGFFIEIDDTIYRGYLPDGHNLNTSVGNLPLAIYLDWEIIPSNCGEEIILISAIEAQ